MPDVPEPPVGTRLGEVAEPLYGLPLEEFTATRDARAKELRALGERDLARQVAALRRPTTAAWAVNHLVRARRDEIEQLLELGAALREAQGAFAGEELRRLDRQQHRVIAAIRQQARAVAARAGQRLTETVGRQVEATLRAGMADPAAADAIRSGLLVRHLESTGFDPVDLEGAVAVLAAAARPSGTGPASGGRGPIAGGRDDREEAGPREQREEAERREREEAERREREEAGRSAAERRRQERAGELRDARALVAATTRALHDADDVLRAADAELAAAARRREAIAARLAELRSALAAAEADEAAAADEVALAEEARTRAAHDVEDAARSAERAGAALAGLERGDRHRQGPDGSG